MRSLWHCTHSSISELPRRNRPVFPPCGLWHERHCPCVSGLCTTASPCVSTWWQNVHVCVLSRCNWYLCCAGSTSLWHASHAFTFTGPCRILYPLTSAWHSAVTQVLAST